jgi:SAM-dependent methyltransferase
MHKDHADHDWHGYYAAQAGRAPRPVFEAVVAAAGPGENRLAVELGSGDGTESLALLGRGWRVLAVDKEAEAMALLRSKVVPQHRDRLQTVVALFEDVSLPPCELVYAGYSLPFTPPAHFAAVWGGLVRALKPGGHFAGQLFGERDTWAALPSMSTQSRAQALALLAPFEILTFDEREEDGSSFSGPKHWHIFDIIARRRAMA